MIEQKAFMRMAQELETLLAEKHGLSSGPLSRRLTKGLRRAPRAVKRAADGFVQAQIQMGNPKLMRLMDKAQVESQFQTLRDHLRAIDVADRRKGLVLSLLGSLSFNLIAVAAILVILLVWRGFL